MLLERILPTAAGGGRFCILWRLLRRIIINRRIDIDTHAQQFPRCLFESPSSVEPRNSGYVWSDNATLVAAVHRTDAWPDTLNRRHPFKHRQLLDLDHRKELLSGLCLPYGVVALDFTYVVSFSSKAQQPCCLFSLLFENAAFSNQCVGCFFMRVGCAHQLPQQLSPQFICSIIA